jgi:hypothetical protein
MCTQSDRLELTHPFVLKRMSQRAFRTGALAAIALVIYDVTRLEYHNRKFHRK